MEQHPLVSKPLITVAGSLRNTATILAVLVATRSPKSSLNKAESLPRARLLEIGTGQGQAWLRFISGSIS